MNAKHLETLIKQGHQVAVKNNHGCWKVFLFINGDGNFQGTYMTDTIQECLDRGLVGSSSSSSSPERIETKFTDEYQIVTQAPLMLEEGDLVDISENVREIAEEEARPKECINMIGQKGLEIDYILDFNYVIHTKDKTDCYNFPTRAVSLSAPTKEVEEMTLEEICKELGREIKIIK